MEVANHGEMRTGVGPDHLRAPVVSVEAPVRITGSVEALVAWLEQSEDPEEDRRLLRHIAPGPVSVSDRSVLALRATDVEEAIRRTSIEAPIAAD